MGLGQEISEPNAASAPLAIACCSDEEMGPLRGVVGRTLRRRSICGGSHGVYRSTGRRKLSMVKQGLSWHGEWVH